MEALAAPAAQVQMLEVAAAVEPSELVVAAAAPSEQALVAAAELVAISAAAAVRQIMAPAAVAEPVVAFTEAEPVDLMVAASNLMAIRAMQSQVVPVASRHLDYLLPAVPASGYLEPAVRLAELPVRHLPALQAQQQRLFKTIRLMLQAARSLWGRQLSAPLSSAEP
jgi:hypothetical protein